MDLGIKGPKMRKLNPNVTKTKTKTKNKSDGKARLSALVAELSNP